MGENDPFTHCCVQLQTLPLWQLRQVLCQPVVPASLGITSALGPMKMSPSRAPAMTRTCLGLPTLEETAKGTFLILGQITRAQSRCSNELPVHCAHLQGGRSQVNLHFLSYTSEFCVKNMSEEASRSLPLSLSLSPLPFTLFSKNFILKF